MKSQEYTLAAIVALLGGVAGCTPRPASAPSSAPSAPQRAEAPAVTPGPTKSATASDSATITVVVESLSNQNPVFSADGEHVVAHVGDGHPPLQLAMDGKKLPAGDEVGYGEEIALASDGSWLSYLGRAPSGAYAVVHGGRRIPVASGGVIAVSADGAHWAAAIYDSSQPEAKILRDGKNVFSGHTPTQLRLSRDGRRFAFVALVRATSSTSRVFVDGTPGPAVDGVSDLQFSADGRHVAYRAITPKGAQLYVDGTPGKRYASVGEDVVFLSDQRLYYQAGRMVRGDQKSFVVVGTKEFGPYTYLRARVHAGSNVAWAAETKHGELVTLRIFLNGREVHALGLGELGPLDDRVIPIAGLVVHPLEEQVAAGLGADGSAVLHVFTAGGAAEVTEVVGEPVAMDGTGNRVALVAARATQPRQVLRTTLRPWKAVVDGPPVDKIHASTVRFSPDGKHVHYFAEVGGDLVRVRQAT